MIDPPLIVGCAPSLTPDTAARLVARGTDTSGVEVLRLDGQPDPASAHLVVTTGTGPDGANQADVCDVWLPPDAPEAVDRFWEQRATPFARNLALQRRAPRTQTVSIRAYDRSWPAAAARIRRRIEAGLGDRAQLVEHVGSTSVPGMAGKDLVDILVVVPDLAVVDGVAVADWHRTGLVPVSGHLYGIDRHDREHPQRVAVDADPGRPVNVHLHPRASPVWRELLAFRDWLRADESHRHEYADLKRHLARTSDGDVNAYSRAKRTWINHAVARALEPGPST